MMDFTSSKVAMLAPDKSINYRPDEHLLRMLSCRSRERFQLPFMWRSIDKYASYNSLGGR